MRRTGPIRIAFAAVALAAGCDAVDSSTVTTDEMRLWVDVDIDAAGSARAVAQLTTDNQALLEETYVRLAAGDRLTVSVGGDSSMMREERIALLNIYQYSARLDGVAAGDRIEVSLERAADYDAPRSRVEVPDEFAIAELGSGFSRRDGIEISWSRTAAADEAQLLVSGGCFESISERFDGNPGRVALSARDFVAPDGAGSCPATIEVKLTNIADVDPRYGRGGSIQAHQSRIVELTAAP